MKCCSEMASCSRTLFTFRTRLGWIAVLGSGQKLSALTFGHASTDAAMNALDTRWVAGAQHRRWNDALVRKLQAYARGVPETFSDVEIDLGGYTEFQLKVIRACRRVPWGTTVSYGELALRAGFPGAARAVGTCMARNRIPLVIPCHRVLGADGRLHGYSGVGGLTMKRQLLELKGASPR
jgi:methylated-DNA-[protein]-cysteine S-methyltransferase